MAKKQQPASAQADQSPASQDTAPEAGKVKREPTPVETVTMQDGKIVEFPGKVRMKKTTSIDGEGNVSLRIDFRSGFVVAGTLPSELILTSAAHGMSQKVGDAAAGEKDIEDAEVEVQNLMKRICEGKEWAAPREAGSSTGAGLLVRALAQVYSKPIDEMRTFVAGLPKAEANELRNSPQLAPTIAALKSAKADPNAPKAADILARIQG